MSSVYCGKPLYTTTTKTFLVHFFKDTTKANKGKNVQMNITSHGTETTDTPLMNSKRTPVTEINFGIITLPVKQAGTVHL
jgi:hypothetical protein